MRAVHIYQVCSQRAVAMRTTATYRVLGLEEPLLLPPVVPCRLDRRGVVGVKVRLRQICGKRSEQSYHMKTVMRITILLPGTRQTPYMIKSTF
jgi:hypothetical protein